MELCQSTIDTAMKLIGLRLLCQIMICNVLLYHNEYTFVVCLKYNKLCKEKIILLKVT